MSHVTIIVLRHHDDIIITVEVNTGQGLLLGVRAKAMARDRVVAVLKRLGLGHG